MLTQLPGIPIPSEARQPEIGVYNDFVQRVADAAPVVGAWDIKWSALLSTVSVDARDNTETNPLVPGVDANIPIYRIDGKLFRSSYTRLWEGFDGPFVAEQVRSLGISEL